MIGLRTDYEEGSRIAREKFGVAAPSQRTATPNTINVETVRLLEKPRRFEYRGRAYTIGKVSWLDGIGIEFLNEEIQRLLTSKMTKDVLLELEHALVDALAMFWRLTEPESAVERLKRALGIGANPFESMTLGEFVVVLGFYSECRTLLPDLSLGNSTGKRTGSRLHTILPTVWRSSSSGSRRGLTIADGRSATIISGLGSAGSGSTTAGSR